MHACIYATFLVDNDTGLLVTGFQEALELMLVLVAIIIDKESLPLSLSEIYSQFSF